MSNISGNTFFIENSVNCSDLGTLNGQVTFIDTSKNCGQVLNAIFSGNGVCNEGQACGCTVFYNSYNYGYVCGTGILRGNSRLYGGADCVILCDQSFIDASAEVTDYELLVNYSTPVNCYSLDNCYYTYSSGVATLATGGWSNAYIDLSSSSKLHYALNPYGGRFYPIAYQAQDTCGWYKTSSDCSAAPIYPNWPENPYYQYFVNMAFSGENVNINTDKYVHLVVGNTSDNYQLYISGISCGALSGAYFKAHAASNESCHYFCYVILCNDYSGGVICSDILSVNIPYEPIPQTIGSCIVLPIQNAQLVEFNGNTVNVPMYMGLYYDPPPVNYFGSYRFVPFDPIGAHDVAYLDNCVTDMMIYDGYGNAIPIRSLAVNYCNNTPQLSLEGNYIIYCSGIGQIPNGAYSNYYLSNGSIVSGKIQANLNENMQFCYEFPFLAQDNNCYYYYISGVACDPFLLKKVFPFSDQCRDCAIAYLREEDVPDFINHTDSCALYSYFNTGDYGTGIIHSEAPSLVGCNQPFLSRNCSFSYFLTAGNNVYTIAKLACTFTTPIAAATDSFLNDLSSCAIGDRIYFTFDCGTSYLANGYYSNGIFCGNGRLALEFYPSLTPQCVLDNACYYIYDTGYQAILANGNFSNGYFINGEEDLNYICLTPTSTQDDGRYFYYCNGTAYMAEAGPYCNFYICHTFGSASNFVACEYTCLLPQAAFNTDCNYFTYISGIANSATGAYSNYYFEPATCVATTCSITMPIAAQDNCIFYTYCDGCAAIVTGCRNDVPGYDAYPTGAYNFGDNGENNPVPCFYEYKNGPYEYTYYCADVPFSRTGVINFDGQYCYVCAGPGCACAFDGRYGWIYHSTLCCGFDPVPLGYGYYGLYCFDKHTVTCLTESSSSDTYSCTYFCNNELCCNGIVMLDNIFCLNIRHSAVYDGVVNLSLICHTCWSCRDLFCDDYCTCTYDVYNTEDPPVCIGQDTCQVCCGQSCCGSEVTCNISCIYCNAIGFTSGYMTGYHTYLCVNDNESVTCDSLDIIYEDENCTLNSYVRTAYGGPTCKIYFIDLV